MLFVAIVKSVVSLISFLAIYYLCKGGLLIFFKLILYPATLLKVFMSCRSSLVEFFWVTIK